MYIHRFVNGCEELGCISFKNLLQAQGSCGVPPNYPVSRLTQTSFHSCISQSKCHSWGVFTEIPPGSLHDFPVLGVQNCIHVQSTVLLIHPRIYVEDLFWHSTLLTHVQSTVHQEPQALLSSYAPQPVSQVYASRIVIINEYMNWLL